MGAIRNILFVMADQLRADYLSCYGHPHLKTPSIDALAARGVRFTRAYAQAPVCGPSRMSFYTGRYVSSHGSTYNGVPLRVGEMTIGDHLRPLGLRTALVGKTHMTADLAGMARLGVTRDTVEGVLSAECGFEPYERDDGLWPDQSQPRDLAYNRWLRDQGYEGDNPWHSAANSTAAGSGWSMRHAKLPALVKEEHSETAWMTGRAMDFIDEAGDVPWCLHLSYIKPHWPYIAPAPYHEMFGPADVIPANRSEGERADPHPVHGAYMGHEESLNFARDEVREAVIPAYMGLVRQIDDHLGRLWEFMERRGLWQNTLVVVTSDHGDYLGDHWLGEKELFHEESVRIPLVIHDPDDAADGTRGTADNALVEAIDLAPTFVEAAGGRIPSHVLEGRSLMPRLRRKAVDDWREVAVSECDYAFREARKRLGDPVATSKAWMVRSHRWKYVEFAHHRPQLFDLSSDPRELRDLGGDAAFDAIRREMRERLFEWMRHRKMRVTLPDEVVEARTGTHKDRGYTFGVW